MKILKQGATEIYDYTCEEIIEETCPVCKAVFEYTENDIEQEVKYHPINSNKSTSFDIYVPFILTFDVPTIITSNDTTGYKLQEKVDTK